MRNSQKKLGLMKADLNTLLQSSDYISIHVPLLDSTYHLLDAQKMSTMKKTAKIINTSRGGVVDEDALYDAIKNGTLGGAALDVFEKGASNWKQISRTRQCNFDSTYWCSNKRGSIFSC